MSDLVSVWAAQVRCPACDAQPGDPCVGNIPHIERVVLQPVAAALVALEQAAIAHAASGAGLEHLVAAAVVTTAQLAAHDQASCQILFNTFASALTLAQRSAPS